MSPRIPLPPDIPLPVFGVNEAIGAGLGRGRLRGADLAAPYRGVRIATDHAPTLLQLCLARSLTLNSDAWFSGITAAALTGVPLPARLEGSAVLHVTVPSPMRAPAGRGVSGHSQLRSGGDIRRWRGVTISTPERLWCELGASLNLTELVAAGDYLIHWDLPHTNEIALAKALSTYPGRGGVPVLRRALELLHPRSESPKESELRVILVLAGLPGLAVNWWINTTDGFRYRADLAFPLTKVVLEYQSAFHESRESRRRDMTRRSRLEARGG
ncbi:MAG: hypothetical protein ABJA94_04985 [Rhodoglobus sp.]